MDYISSNNIKLPKRAKNSKKGDNGKVLAVAGSKEYVGAVALAGIAALRAGADWVTVAAPEKVAWAINSLSADLVTFKLKGNYISSNHYKKVKELEKKHDTLLIGNGIGLKKQTKILLKKIIKTAILKVIDADGIKLLSAQELKNSIITPHSGELKIFMENSEISKKIINSILAEKNIQKKALLIKEALSKKKFFENSNVVLLKGRIDIVMSKNRTMFNRTGNEGMTKAGTGDVLAGLTAGFLAQSKDLFQSAVNAAYFNGLIGNILLKKKKGFAYLASDMAAEIKNCKFFRQL